MKILKKTRALGDAIVAFKNLIATLVFKNPVLIVALIYAIDLGVRGYLAEGFSQNLLMMVIILFVSMGIYASTNSFSETTLSFILGVLTVFTINWKEANIGLFICFYLIYLLFVFYAKQIKIMSKQETILIQAANKLSDDSNFNEVFSNLKKISLSLTDGKQLTILQKSEVIRYLSYRQMIISEMEDAIKSVEVIYCICQISLNEACEVFYGLYLYSKNKMHSPNNVKAVLDYFDLIVTVPLSYSEFFAIFKSTKKLLYEGKYSFQQYISEIKLLALAGYGDSEIIDRILES